MKFQWLVIIAAVRLVLAPVSVAAQMEPRSGEMMRQADTPGAPMGHAPAPTPFYRERTFLVLLGVGIAGAGFVAFRITRLRWRKGRGPVEFVSEAVLVVDLVDSTHLATHYGDVIAMNARNAIKERTLAAAEPHGLTFAEDTGDGYFMTFPSVSGAVQTAVALLRDLRDRPPNLSPGPPLEARVGISYGQILLDTRASRHGAAINKAFRIEGLSRDSFAQLEGESALGKIPDRNRIFLDEEAAQEVRSAHIPLRPIGFCRLKGFSGLHRVFEVLWAEAMESTASDR